MADVSKLIELLVQMKDEASSKLDTLIHKINELTGVSELARFALVAIAGGTVVGAIEALVGQFIEAEDAVTKLNAALAIGGHYTAEGSKEIQDMAAQMQHLTTTSSTAAIQISATIGSIAKDLTVGQLAQMQRAAIGLHEAYGMSVQRASLLIARSLEGQSNMLRKYGIDLDTSMSAQERANVIIEKTAGMFSLAEAAANTLGGRIQQTKNEWHEFQQTLGQVIVQAFGVKDVVNDIREFIIHLNATVREHIGTIMHWVDVAKAAFHGVWTVIKTLVDSFIQQARMVWDAIKTLFNLVDTGFHNLFGAGVLKSIWVAVSAIVAVVEVLGIVTAAAFKNGVTVMIEFYKAAFYVGQLIGDAIIYGVYWFKSNVNDLVNWWIDRLNDVILKMPKKMREFLGIDTIQHVSNEAAEYLADAKAAITTDANNIAMHVGRIIDSSTAAFKTMKDAVTGLPDRIHTIAHAWDGLVAALNKPIKQMSLPSLGTKDVQNQGDGKNDNLDQEVRGLLRQQQELDAAYKAGAIGVTEYNASVLRLTDSIKELLKNKKLTKEEAVQLYNALVKLQGLSLGQRLKDEFLEVKNITESTNSQVAKMVIGFRDDMASAITKAFDAHKNFGETLKKEVGKAAAHYATLSVGRAVMETAEGIAASFFNPPAAQAHFHAAETFLVAAAAMGAIAGATGGFSGGGSSQSAAEATNQAVSNQANGVTIVLPSGVTGSPAWMEEFEGNLEEIRNRRVIFKQGSA